MKSKGNTKNNRKNRHILASGLFQLCSEQSNGTVFILTKNDKFAQFVIQNSSIISFSFDNKHGEEAVQEFKNLKFKQSQFIEGFYFPLPKEANISCSDTLLNALGYREFLIKQSSGSKNLFHFDTTFVDYAV